MFANVDVENTQKSTEVAKDASGLVKVISNFHPNSKCHGRYFSTGALSFWIMYSHCSIEEFHLYYVEQSVREKRYWWEHWIIHVKCRNASFQVANWFLQLSLSYLWSNVPFRTLADLQRIHRSQLVEISLKALLHKAPFMQIVWLAILLRLKLREKYFV